MCESTNEADSMGDVSAEIICLYVKIQISEIMR